MSVKVVMVSHGKFSEGLADSVQMLTGEQTDLVYYGLFPGETLESFVEKLRKELENTPEGVEVLFLSDLFHGSPFNAVVELMRDYKLYHLTGANLPVAILVMMSRYSDMSAEEICEAVMEEAAESVMYVNAMFDADGTDMEDEEEDD